MADKNYLQWLASDTQTVWWHDSADAGETARAIKRGASGSTTNPILISQALAGKRDLLISNADEINAADGDDERAEAIIKVITKDHALRFLPIYKKSGGKNGYVCAQVNPNKPMDTDYMVKNALRIREWAENVSVKIPVTNAGLDAIEECAAKGLNVTATVSFTASQAVAAAERYEKGRAGAAKAPGIFNAVIMVGRLDDYLREVARDNRIDISEEDIIKAGLSVIKRAYGVFKDNKYEAALMPAGMRGHYHVTELAGAGMRMSVHPKIQELVLASGRGHTQTIDRPIDEGAVSRLMKLGEFVRAYEPDGMKPEEFITYGVTQRTLAMFTDAWAAIATHRIE